MAVEHSGSRGKFERDKLFKAAKKGLRKMYGANPGLIERLAYEVNVVSSVNGLPYLLLMADLARLAVRRGMDFRCCGAANASLLCHCLGITNIDPIRHDLTFERFLYPGQAHFPEIRLSFGAANNRTVSDEMPALRELITRFKPQTFEDFCVLAALRHPSQAKQAERYFLAIKNAKKSSFFHPSVESALDETFGVLVYEEQAIRILQTTGGLTLAQACEFSRKIRKSEGFETGKWKSLFLANVVKRGIAKKPALAIFEYILENMPFLGTKIAAVETAFSIKAAAGEP